MESAAADTAPPPSSSSSSHQRASIREWMEGGLSCNNPCCGQKAPAPPHPTAPPTQRKWQLSFTDCGHPFKSLFLGGLVNEWAQRRGPTGGVMSSPYLILKDAVLDSSQSGLLPHDTPLNWTSVVVVIYLLLFVFSRFPFFWTCALGVIL